MPQKMLLQSNSKPARSPRSGFTLIEILIVAGLIGMLAVIAIPSFLRSSGRAKSQICLNNLRQINGAVETWALEKNQNAGSPVNWTDISVYIKREPSCPLGGTTFANSYTITTTSERATCQRGGAGIPPATHILP